MECSSDVFVDVRGVVHFITDEHLLPRKSLLELIWYFLSLLVLHLPLGFKDQFQGFSDSLFVVGDIEVGVPGMGRLHDDVVDVEGLVVGPEVQTAESDEGEEIAIGEGCFGVRVHLLKLYN